MNSGNWFLLIVGLSICLVQYLKRIENPKIALRVWANNENSLIKLESEKKCHEAESEINALRTLFSATAVIIVLAITNWQFNYISGPILLSISGALFGFAILKFRQSTVDVELKFENNREARLELEQKLNHINKEVAKGLVAILLISGFWGYRIQQDMNEQKQAATNEALNLSGEGWCSNFWDIDASGGYENIVKTGGWPCITIGSISNIVFSKKSANLEMCFNYSVTRSDGLPSDESVVEYDFDRLCSTDSWFTEDGGWSTSTFERKIYERIKPDLDRFRISACNRFYFTLSEEEKIVYC